MEIESQFNNVGRNDPCPCGSNKKFKKCHGENTPWQGSAKAANEVSASGDQGDAQSAMPQFDPSKMDLNWLADFSSAIQRLPKGQLNQLQVLMQKAMNGKDVSRELDELQKKLPTSVQEMLNKSPELDAQLASAETSSTDVPISLTDEQKVKLQEIQKNNEKAGLSGLWNRFRKK